MRVLPTSSFLQPDQPTIPAKTPLLAHLVMTVVLRNQELVTLAVNLQPLLVGGPGNGEGDGSGNGAGGAAMDALSFFLRITSDYH